MRHKTGKASHSGVEVKSFGIVADVFQVRLCSGLRTRQGWGTVPACGNLEGRRGEYGEVRGWERGALGRSGRRL